MVASRIAGIPPRDLALLIAAGLAGHSEIESIEVAGPGFINLTVSQEAIAASVGEVLSRGHAYARSTTDKPLRINVEFVSVNPNGPITIGSGRGAAYGSALCNVLEAAGHTVHREYYINDGVNSEQMRLFAESVKALVEGRAVPENGYKGDYVAEVADELRDAGLVSVDDYQKASETKMIATQRKALSAFGVEYDTWFSEQSLHDSGVVSAWLEKLVDHGVADDEPYRTKLQLGRGGVIDDVIREEQVADEEEGDGQSATVWLRSTKFGDDMDRVLRRRDGRLTYIASDVAYHADKFNRPSNADKLITILGPDHHGYIGRLTAVVAAVALSQDSVIGSDEAEAVPGLYRDGAEAGVCQAALKVAKDRLEVLIYQLVRFMKDGKPAPMRKRDGNIYALMDLISEIGAKVRPGGNEAEQHEAGKDVARFFYLMRHHDTTFDFDLDLAERQSDENPVFYVQYAHARICSVVDRATESGLSASAPDLRLLTDRREKDLALKLADLPYEVRRCAADYSVNRLTTYAVELARTYHAFYDHCRVIQLDQKGLSEARLALCEATKIGLQSVLGILGVSSPERMERPPNPEHFEEN